MSYQQLIREHADIDRLSQRMLTVVDGPVDNVGCAWRTMWAIIFLMHAHIAGEEASVYAAMLRDDDPQAAPMAEMFAAEMDVLERDWRAHTARWTVQAITSDWKAFGEATRVMATRLSERVHAETDTLYPFALRRSIIKLRTQAV